jgi:hypothetical protein
MGTHRWGGQRGLTVVATLRWSLTRKGLCAIPCIGWAPWGPSTTYCWRSRGRGGPVGAAHDIPTTMTNGGGDDCPFELMTREKERSWKCTILCSSSKKKEADKMLTGGIGSMVAVTMTLFTHGGENEILARSQGFWGGRVHGEEQGSCAHPFWILVWQRCGGAAMRRERQQWREEEDPCSGGSKKRKVEGGIWPGVGGGCRPRHRRGRGMGVTWGWRQRWTHSGGRALWCERERREKGRRPQTGWTRPLCTTDAWERRLTAGPGRSDTGTRQRLADKWFQIPFKLGLIQKEPSLAQMFWNKIMGDRFWHDIQLLLLQLSQTRNQIWITI